MDSGNSGSMQSSSGGDEEYDSRADQSFSAFLNSSTAGQVGGVQQPPISHHHQTHHHPSSLFDPLSNYLDPFSRSPPPPPNANSLLNLDAVWSRGLRSEPNCTDIGGLMNSSSSSQPISTTHGGLGRNPFPTSSSSMPLPSTGHPESGSSRPSPSPDQTNQTRNSKKRSRASRRAPTTVLTTDTSNFRAMVQEFTGIPAPPFSASPFPRSRLDLFSTASSMRSGGHLDPAVPPPYILRPFAHKVSSVQPPSFVPSSTFSTTIASSTSNTNNLSTSDSTSTINYQQLSSDLGLPKQQSQNLFNMQNPILSFQSRLQSPPPPPPKYPLANDSQLRMGGLEEFGLSHGAVNTQLSALPSLVPSEEASLRNENNPTSWGDGNDDHHHHLHLKSFNGNSYGNSSQRVNGCRLNNNAASSSNFLAEKGSENVSSRGEGMVDSWICSSD